MKEEDKKAWGHDIIKPFCSCKEPKYNYPEMVWCDNCNLEIKK